eukprot:gb/GFBE01055554.1/.p1 GENE.gb/GFBE01055554.1/~~gb/GFBE01055554.1/.p1  ORF type:complete len:257 (+),score=58.17 gb/GFBE01055554.1/:1-771(+)
MAITPLPFELPTVLPRRRFWHTGRKGFLFKLRFLSVLTLASGLSTATLLVSSVSLAYSLPLATPASRRSASAKAAEASVPHIAPCQAPRRVPAASLPRSFVRMGLSSLLLAGLDGRAAIASVSGLPSPKDARQQVLAAARKLGELADAEKYAKVAAAGGDNIRREIGTVGTSSPLFDIDKAFKALAEEADDAEAYFEELEKLLKALSGTEADAYSSLFALNSAANVPPEVYIKKAFKELEEANTIVKGLLAMLKLG